MNLAPSGERLRALPASISGSRIDSGEPEEAVHPLHPGKLFWVCLGSFPGGDMMMAHPRGVSWA